MELHPLDLPSQQGNGTKAASSLSAESAISSRLHNAKPPDFVLLTEKPWHRAAALMFAAGSITCQEVADAFGVHQETIRNLMRQDWFQENVTKLMAEHGGKDIMSLFKGEAFNSLVTLVTLRDGKDTPKTVKRACAVDILDRALGKPLQRVEQTGSPTSADPVREAQQLEESNTRLRNQLQNGVLRNPGEIPEQQPKEQGDTQ